MLAAEPRQTQALVGVGEGGDGARGVVLMMGKKVLVIMAGALISFQTHIHPYTDTDTDTHTHRQTGVVVSQ